jgi:hypothetical protein
MQRELLSAVATLVLKERGYANGDNPSIQPETNNIVFDLGVRIIDNNWLVEGDPE